jgi:hypothetical protein
MKIEKQQYRQLIIAVSSQLRMAEIEILALQAVFHQLKGLGLPQPHLDHMLRQAKTSPALQKRIQEKYDAPLEKLLEQFDLVTEDQDQDLMAQLLAAWQSTGPVQ